MGSCSSQRVQISSFDKLQTMTYGYLKSALGPVVVVPFCAQFTALYVQSRFAKSGHCVGKVDLADLLDVADRRVPA